jgi:hypothetical protein
MPAGGLRNLALTSAVFQEFPAQEGEFRAEQKAGVRGAAGVEFLAGGDVLVEHPIGMVKCGVAVVIHHEQAASGLFESELEVGTELVAIQGDGSGIWAVSCDRGAGRFKVFATAGRGLNFFQQESFFLQPDLQSRSDFGAKKNRLPAPILPSLGQGDHSHDMPGAHQDTGIRADEEGGKAQEEKAEMLKF